MKTVKGRVSVALRRKNWMGETRAVRTDVNTWTFNENLNGIFTSVCTHASTLHVLGGMYARLHRASNSDCAFAQVQRFESDM